ncbi:CLUMA_CG013731, isoform A [Clunio marinus]|uniref:CLUMA_CG013731, isoform A n=1 Tax=Clunio marinus TaxID=568069 RepID=A0A1J1IJQ0_9DIPT|nr:CLUMA_CG013731, isoform A [Clunio marinus]
MKKEIQSQIEQQQQQGSEDKKRTGWPQSVWGRETLGRKTLK